MTYHYLPRPGDVVAYRDAHGVWHSETATADSAEGIAYCPEVVLLEAAPEGHYRGVTSRLVKQSRGDQIRKWVDLVAVEQQAITDLSEAAHNGPLRTVSDAIQDVLTSADMVKDGRYLA